MTETRAVSTSVVSGVERVAITFVRPGVPATRNRAGASASLLPETRLATDGSLDDKVGTGASSIVYPCASAANAEISLCSPVSNSTESPASALPSMVKARRANRCFTLIVMEREAAPALARTTAEPLAYGVITTLVPRALV